VTAIATQWHDLPAAVRHAIEQHTGPVHHAEPHGEGLSTSLRLILHTPHGPVFAKGTGPQDDEARNWRLDTGAALTPHVQAIAPQLHWHIKHSGWNIAGYAYIPGRPWADQHPGSPDIPKMTATLAQLAAIPAPPQLDTTAADCWAHYADDPAPLHGNALIHRDLNPANFIITTERAWLVDWGWAVRGPAWLTPALLTLTLMEAGWDPATAENTAAALPAWHTATPRDLAAFATANARMWDHALTASPGWPRDFRAHIARQWADHRAALTP
jgi:hypothetical protein